MGQHKFRVGEAVGPLKSVVCTDPVNFYVLKCPLPPTQCLALTGLANRENDVCLGLEQKLRDVWPGQWGELLDFTELLGLLWS